MKPVTLVTPYSPEPLFKKTLLSLVKSNAVERVFIVTRRPIRIHGKGCSVLPGASLSARKTLDLILAAARTEYLLLWLKTLPVSIEPAALEKVLEAAASTKAGLVYSDFYDENNQGRTLHPLNDYQPGSVRDDFDFGAMLLLSVEAVRWALNKYGPIPRVRFAGLYDLRLKISIDHPIHHLKEPIYVTAAGHSSQSPPYPGEEAIFSYVDPRNRNAQREMEAVFTSYLKKVGAYLPGYHLKRVEKEPGAFPVDASVVIPVLNRRETIGEAVGSALDQKTGFSFNVIVVDNHSTDGTTAILAGLAAKYPKLKHVIPMRTNLGIGGCWNEALRSESCGRYAVQLDSDDLYSSRSTLQKMVEMLRLGGYGMVIGSYTLVNSKMEEIAPFLIDHREWTEDNGHNNALRINGLGAPRAFDTSLMRRLGFRNVNYGEDYAAALRICREYRVGRIYDSLYLCRRWQGNTDAGLSLQKINRNNALKDRIRTLEILARQKITSSLHKAAIGNPLFKPSDGD